MNVPRAVAAIFWNVDPDRLDVERGARLIISTIVPRGGEEALRWLFRTYGADRVLEVVLEDARGLRTMPDAVLTRWLRVLAPGVEVPAPTTRRQRWAPRRFEQLARRQAHMARRYREAPVDTERRSADGGID